MIFLIALQCIRCVEILKSLEEITLAKSSTTNKPNLNISVLNETKIGVCLNKLMKAFRRFSRSDDKAEWKKCVDLSQGILTAWKDNPNCDQIYFIKRAFALCCWEIVPLYLLYYKLGKYCMFGSCTTYMSLMIKTFAVEWLISASSVHLQLKTSWDAQSFRCSLSVTMYISLNVSAPDIL